VLLIWDLHKGAAMKFPVWLRLFFVFVLAQALLEPRIHGSHSAQQLHP